MKKKARLTLSLALLVLFAVGSAALVRTAPERIDRCHL